MNEIFLDFIDEPNDNTYRVSLTGNVVFTVTPGLGVFLTTSSRHTPHVFERVLERIHAVCQYNNDHLLIENYFFLSCVPSLASTSSNLSQIRICSNTSR